MTLGRYAIVSALITAFLMVCSFRLGQATTTIRFDGTWWKDLTLAQQLAAVQGVMGGFETGYRRGSLDGSLEQISVISKLDDGLMRAFFIGERSKYLTAYYHFVGTSMQSGLYQKIFETAKKSAAHENQKNRVWLDEPQFPSTFGTYMDGITHFYENNLSKGDWTAAAVMSCLSSVPDSRCSDVQR